MFVIRVDLLSDRYAATAYNDRERVEWPPHPARLFSALVATWAEGEPGAADAEAELSALQWLEEQPPPVIVASSIANAGVRSSVVVFVPVNDVGVIKAPDHAKLEAAERTLAAATDAMARAKAERQLANLRDKLIADTVKETAAPTRFGKHDAASGEQALLDRRVRQPRTFPCALPEQPAFAFEWRDSVASPAVVTALSRLTQRVVRLGHSSSLVHARVVTVADLEDLATTTTRFIPDDRNGEIMIRWVGPGQVERLVRAHAQHQQVEPRVLPARFIRYRHGDRPEGEPPACSVFDDELIVYARVSGPRLPITSVAGLSRQFRRALMSVAEQPIPEVISGHQPEGAPSETTHLAIVPLPVVVGPHADGAVLGLALVLPRTMSDEARRAVMRAVAQLEQQQRMPKDDDAPPVMLLLGEAGALTVKRVVWGEDLRTTLQPSTWTRRSKRWASATPVALDRNPGDLHDPDPSNRAKAFELARALVIEAVRRIGLPPPLELDVVRSCVLPGTTKPRGYPRFPSDAHKQQRVLVHVRLGFANPVQGPIVLGAGRYQGLGLCLPVDRVGPELS
jgi:CRISPR-associated protein Csb2